MTQEQLPMVAMPSMNDTHLEDVIMINELARLIDEADMGEITAKLDILIGHTIEHFSGEEKMMLEKGFPPYQMHKTEHDKALAQMKEVSQHWKEYKDLNALSQYIKVFMPAWLVQHVSTMDTVTARFLVA